METAKSTFRTVLKVFEELTCDPDLFLEQAPSEAEGFKNVAKKLHRHSVEANSLTRLKANSLPELLVDGFDKEQIWQQIELQNKSAFLHFSNNLSKFDPNGLSFGVDTENAAVPNEGPYQDDPSDAVAPNESLDEDDLSDAESLSDDYQDPISDYANESDDAVNFDERDQPFEDDESDDEMETEIPKSILKKSTEKPKSILKKSAEKDVDISENEISESSSSPSKKKSNQRKYKTKVDDQFFKLSKLEQFLRVEDLKEERVRDGDLQKDKESDEDEDEELMDEDIDLFQDIPSDDLLDEDESEDEEIANKKSSRELMYEDFFDAPDSGDENEDETLDPEQDVDLNDDEMDLSKNKEEGEGDIQADTVPDQNSKQASKTQFELEQEKIKQQIEEYEEKMLKPTAWHLTGEVDSTERPTDALLHLQTDFQMNAKPVIIQDTPLCEKLESMLKTTIKNKSFSDGVKQYKTNDEIIAKKKEIIIEQTKSKKSLAQEYEDMYLKKKNGQEEEENPKHKDIKKLMDSLFPELHALFSHIPKPAIPDIKIVSNLPAISVEEVAPTSVSDVTLLAPEEVKKRTGLVKGQTERTDVDRKRERRKKKFLQKTKQKKREKESGDKPLSAKAQKREKIDMIRKLKQQRNTKFAKVDGQKIKSSKDFFERLQDTVSTTVNKLKGKKKS